MRKRIWAALLAAVMMTTALTGCSSQTETTAAPTKEAEATTEAKTEAPATEAPITAAPTTEAVTEAAESASSGGINWVFISAIVLVAGLLVIGFFAGLAPGSR